MFLKLQSSLRQRRGTKQPQPSPRHDEAELLSD